VSALDAQILKIVMLFERKEGRRGFYLALKKVVRGSSFEVREQGQDSSKASIFL